MASVFDFLFQGSPPPSVTGSVTSVTGFPDWYQELMRANIGNAVSTASQPYQAFPGQQVASITSPTQQSWANIQANQGIQTPSLNQASGALGSVAGGFNQTEYEKYRNPYTMDVVNNIAELGNRNLFENVLPGVNDTFTRSGQFGSTRHGDFTNRALRDSQEAISDAQNTALMQGTQNSMANYMQGQSNQISAGSQLGALGQIYQNTAIKDSAALGQIGSEQQAQNQKNLDVAYQNFQNQNAYGQNQAAWLNSMIRGIAAPTQSTVTTTNPATSSQQGASPLYQAGQAAAGVSGLGSLANSSIVNPVFG